jgi:hypothetical protein
MSKPADMRALTDKQSAWVREFVLNGGNATAAAVSAEYSRESAAQRGWENRNLPHVQVAVQTELRKTFTDLAAIAVGQARLMLLDPKTPASARCDIIKTVLDRAGLGAPKGDTEDNEDRPLSSLTLVQLEALALRVTLRPTQHAPSGAGRLLEGSLASPVTVDLLDPESPQAGE